MARLPLIHIPHGLYSVVSKCNNNEFLFDSQEKFKLYINHLILCKKTLGFTIYDIVCMSNHVHELYRVPKKVTIAQILQMVKGQFAQKFNKMFGRTGHFWKNKPFYRIIENEEYALNTMNYFHFNPVRAGIVTRPQDWPFSGYSFHVLGQKNNLLGKLLDPLPNFRPTQQKQDIYQCVRMFLNRKRQRFIGNLSYMVEMKKTWGR